MTSERDVERVLERWLVDGIDEMPDRVFASIVDRVDRQPQQRAWRLRSWRFPTMSTPLKLALTGAALLAVLLGGTVFLSGGGIGPGPTPSPTPSPTNSPTTSPKASPKTQTLIGGVQGESMSWRTTVPAGWSAAPGAWFTTPSQGTSGPTGISVTATGAVNVPSDPCDAVGKESDGASVADVVAALEARDDLVVSNAVDTTLGGYSGTRVDVEAPADLGICPDDSVFIFAEPDGSGLPAQGPSNLLRTWILDVAGQPIIVLIESFPGTPADDLADAQQIVDSIVITP